MELFDTTSRLLHQAITGAAARQAVLADNIANANTPGFRRQDVDFQASLRDALAGGDAAIGATRFAAAEDPAGAMRADGNSVDVDAESARMAQNGLLYQALVGVQRGRADILRAALGIG